MDKLQLPLKHSHFVLQVTYDLFLLPHDLRVQGLELSLELFDLFRKLIVKVLKLAHFLLLFLLPNLQIKTLPQDLILLNHELSLYLLQLCNLTL